MRGKRSALVFGALLGQELRMTLHYRWWLAMMQLANVMGPLLSLMVWQGAMRQGVHLSVSPQFLTTYLVLVSLVALMTSSWTSQFLATAIRMGGLNSWVVRPCSTHLGSLANNVAEKLVKTALLLPMLAVLAFAFRDQVHLPADGSRWAMFVVATLLAGTLTFLVDIAVGSMAFWFEDVAGFDRMRTLGARVLSGAVLPLAMFPSAMQGFLEVQPFRYMVSFPIETLLIDDPNAIWSGFAFQAAWVVVGAVAAGALWRRGLRGYQGAGA